MTYRNEIVDFSVLKTEEIKDKLSKGQPVSADDRKAASMAMKTENPMMALGSANVISPIMANSISKPLLILILLHPPRG